MLDEKKNNDSAAADADQTTTPAANSECACFECFIESDTTHHQNSV